MSDTRPGILPGQPGCHQSAVLVTSDATESAVRIHADRIIAKTGGYGACHAAATA